MFYSWDGSEGPEVDFAFVGYRVFDLAFVFAFSDNPHPPPVFNSTFVFESWGYDFFGVKGYKEDMKKYNLKTNTMDELPVDEYGVIDWSQVEIPDLDIKSKDDIKYIDPVCEK